MSRRKSRAGIALAGAGIVVAAVVVIVVLISGTSTTRSPITSHGVPIAAMRTVLVGTGEVEPSAPGGPLRAVYVSGRMPDRSETAVVMTDENCAPDAQGISHCTNKLRMSDGSMMTLTHPHRMAEVPCLAPGEKVSVQRA